MEKQIEAAYRYLNAYQNYFYAWEDGASVIAIPNGPTICYTGYLLELLRGLEPAGAPRLAVLLLAVIATRPDSDKRLALVEQILLKAQPSGPDQCLQTRNDAFRFLRLLGSLPNYFLEDQGRLQLFQHIFQHSHLRIGMATIRSVLKCWDEERIDLRELQNPVQLSSETVRGHLTPLALLYKRFPTVETLLEALADVPRIPAPLPLRAPAATEPQPYADFVDELMDDRNTFAVGALIRRIWSGLHIPLHSSHPSLQPLGGISDIANKGPLDKLLISEYAHEDLQFLSRLANGESLFLQRETPPESEHRERIILIDSALHSWGTPRIIGYALAIAIAKHPKTDISCSAFAVGASAVPVRFGTIPELVESLRQLDASVHPAEGISRFFSENKPGAGAEVIIISAPSSYRQPEVQTAIQQAPPIIRYVITADEQGQIRVLGRKPQGFAPLHEFRLPLKELWKNPPAEKKPAQRGPVAHKESELSVYPILLPWPDKFREILELADGTQYVITKAGGVLAELTSTTNLPARGARLVLEGIPRGAAVYRIGVGPTGDVLLLYYIIANRSINIANLTSGARATARLDEYVSRKPLPEMGFYAGGFGVRSGGGFWKYWLDESDSAQPEIKLQQVEIAGQPALVGPDPVKIRGTITGSIMRQIDSVFIGKDGALQINGRSLELLYDRSLMFTGSKRSTGTIQASFNSGCYNFPDGSTITLCPDGIAQLKSSNANHPPVYIPLVLEGVLGAATALEFAGNEYFRDDRLRQPVVDIRHFYNKWIKTFITTIIQFEFDET